jgi:hypothetical protein
VKYFLTSSLAVGSLGPSEIDSKRVFTETVKDSNAHFQPAARGDRAPVLGNPMELASLTVRAEPRRALDKLPPGSPARC